MHRFCSNCARAQDLPSGECPCCAISGIGGDATAVGVGVGVGGSGPSCSNSMFRNKTTFNEDKQLDQIIATVETIISLLSEALSIYGDDGDDGMSTVGCDKRVEEITNDEESFQEVYDVDDEESMDVDDRSMDYEGEEEDDEDVEVDSITMEDPYSHLRKNAGFDQFHYPEEDDSSDDENYRRYTKQPQYEDEELNTVSLEEYSAVPTIMSQSEEKKKSSKRSKYAEYNKDHVTPVLDEPDSSDDESSISLSLNLKKKQDKIQSSFKNDSRKIVENSHGSTNDLQHNDELVIMDDVINEHHNDHQEDQPDREFESTGDTTYDHYFSNENSNSSHSDTTIPAKESILKQNLKWARPSPQTSDRSDSPIGAQRNPSKSNRRVSFHDETSPDMGSIRKQKKIDPKYAIGTQFIGDINDPTSEKYGRIVGFDGSLYQVYYPKDKTCHSFHEADFEKVKIIQKSSHQRPKKRNQLSVVIKQPCCPECDRPFSSEMLDATKPNVPVQSQNCSHVICIDCVHALRVSNSQQCVGRVNRIRGTVDCPICNNKQSFNGLNPTICVSMTQVVSMYNRMQTMKSTIMPTPKSRRRRRREISEVERRMQKERAHEEFKKQKKIEAYHDRPGRQKEQKHREAPSHPMNLDKGHHSVDDVRIDTSSKHEHGERKKHTRQKEDCRTDEGYKRQKRSAEQGSRSHDREREEKSSRDKNREIKCSSCKRHKPKEKYSSKQQERNKQNKARVFCRRCEEKAIIQDKWGPGTAECSITLNISKGKFQSSTIKFLSSLVPWKYGRVSRQKIDVLPNDLTFDGYTRDSFGRLSNDDEEQERLWKKAEFWTTGDGISRFLDFLKKERKSAFGSFVLPNGKDGFFVLPYDQRDEPQDPKKRSGKNSVSKIVCFKYIIGLDIVGGGSSKADKHETRASGHYDEEFSNATSQEVQPSMLKQLLSAQSETENCLTQVPKGSVRTVLDAQTIPDLPQQSRGPTDWSRGGTVIVEESDRLRKEAKIEAESSSKLLATEESNMMKRL